MFRKALLVRMLVIVAMVSTLSAVFAGPAAAQDEIKLTMTCRCVADGVNAQLVEWLLEHVIPDV